MMSSKTRLQVVIVVLNIVMVFSILLVQIDAAENQFIFAGVANAVIHADHECYIFTIEL